LIRSFYTLRGAGGDVAICEEFAHMDNKIFSNVVVPTLVTGAAFIGITTLGEDSNFVDNLISIKGKDGKSLFRVISVDLVCDRCKRLGKENTCQHLAGEIPHWQDSQRHKDIEQMMQNETDTYMLETK
jgi:hypothetical protein